MNTEQIWSMPYPDFVAFIEQDNTPPGAERTLRWWADAAGIERGSYVLDLACNTGYSSRALARRTGCGGVGIDLSKQAIAAAITAAAGLTLSYTVADACELPWQAGQFSHVVAGCCFSFFQERERALAEAARVLAPGGRLCVALLPYVKEPPRALLDDLERCLGFRSLPGDTLEYWRSFFAPRFELEAEWLEPLTVYDEEQLREAVVAHRFARRERFDALPAAEREAALLRLFRDRVVFNENRRYQTCCRWVLRVRDTRGAAGAPLC